MARTLAFIEAITEALYQEMERDERVFVLGEDIGLSGGVFKATAGLHEKFGEDRVLDTPLAEGITTFSPGSCTNHAAFSCEWYSPPPTPPPQQIRMVSGQLKPPALR